MMKDNIEEIPNLEVKGNKKIHHPDGTIEEEEITLRSVAAADAAGPSMPATPSPAKSNFVPVVSNPSYDESSPMSYSGTARSSSSGEC